MRLKELREQKNESQQKLAIILNISQTMISRYENGQARPKINTLIAIARHYNVSVDYLIGLSNYKLPYTKSDILEEELDLLLLFNRLNYIQKEKVFSYIKGINDG